ncbi:MFS transporter [Salsipaludibacter albus]|uniref:MFS transporter n=1 Tax=Salsipaludibacter albus TaxID=2849650 RepID=UPI001EE3ECEA|nr:MFS transporter [Salsipaludibacter albus]MBY5162234.1 MFS transporter [Salsipaludibacter albus]
MNSRATSPVRPTVIAVLQTTLGMLAPFLLGALATSMRGDVGMSPADLGLAASGFFGVSALVYAFANRRIESLGVQTSTWLGVGFAVASLVLVGVAESTPAIVVAMVLGGPGNAISQLSANMRLAQAVEPTHLGTAVGVKQGAVPLGTMLAGFAVPAIALTVGWRFAFLAAPVLGLPLVVASLSRRGRSSARATARPPRGVLASRRGSLWLLAAAAGLATAAGQSSSVFYVDAVVTAGSLEGTAGLLLALGSAVGAVARIVVGIAADRLPFGHLRAVAGAMLLAVVGFVALSTQPQGAMLALVTILAFAASWGWNGLLTYAVMRLNPDAPAQATGITQTGLSVGAALGPLVAGQVASQASYDLVWLLSAGALAIAGGLTLLARHGLVLDHATERPTATSPR